MIQPSPGAPRLRKKIMNEANNEQLTEEQLMKIERNRSEALERLRKRQSKLLQEQQVHTNNHNLESFSKRAATVRKASTTYPSNTINAANNYSIAAFDDSATRTQHAKTGKLRAPRVVLQLYSADSFSAPGFILLNSIYKSIPDGRFSSDEQLWRFPLSQYSNLCKNAHLAHVR